jgi:ABC-type antimicrobial peptide transport system permease subunit
MSLVIRTPTPEPVTVALRTIVRERDPLVPVFGVQQYERILFVASHSRRVPAYLLMGFSIVALTLAAVGLYGLLAYAVQQRRHELGVRSALGATAVHLVRMAVGALARDVLRLIVASGLRLVLVGAVVGLAAAYAMSRLVESLLFGVSARDPVVYVAATAAVCVIALLASALPAYRASRIDPVTALRSD